MSNDLNQCQFIGRLGADPETRYSAGGDPICNFRIAVGWKTKEKEGAEWVPISTFGKLAEICGQYLRKGSQIYISGRFRTRKWQDRDGQDRYTTEIIADTMQMLGGKAEGKPKDDAGDYEPAPRKDKPKPSFDDFGSEIPF